MDLHLKIIGILLVALSFIHVIFPKYFKWKEELASLSIMNRQMMHVHSFFIAFTVLLMGLLCLTSTDEMQHTVLGRRICLGLGIFWTIRLFIQIFGYSSKLWRRKKFETTVHVLFTLFWIYISLTFFKVYLS